MDANQLWGRLAEEPVFVLTGDQDWAPEWAMQATLDLATAFKVPMHVFATSPSDVLDAAPPEVSVGIHPNFMPGSTHGSTDAQVIDHCLKLYPKARTFRSHCFAENTPALLELAARGVNTDSNTCLFLQPGITPGMHCSGMIRMPVYLEDDVILRFARKTVEIDELRGTLFSPGLKVLNFHPGLVALNTPSLAAYEAARPSLYGPGSQPSPHVGRGIRDLLADIVEAVHVEGYVFESLPAVADQAARQLRAAFPDGICGWGQNISKISPRRR